MSTSRLIPFSTCFAALLLFTHCAPGGGGTGESSGSGGSNGSGGSTASGGSNGSGSSSGSGGPSSSGGSNATGGSGSSTSSGGSNGSGGSGSATSSGGSNGSGGSGGSNGSGGSTGGSGGSTGGSGGSTGGSGGSTGSGGSSGSGGVRMDSSGVALAKAGDSTSTSRKYLNLGDMRLINNRWGSDALNCSGTQQKVYVNSDGTLGWDFNRPTCGGMKADPDFPEVEFGVAPFGTGSSLLTTPAFSSTTLLPIQIKDLTSATANIDTFATTFDSPTNWDSNFEFWISKENPTTSANAGVYAEIIAFLGWQGNRLQQTVGWPCDKSGSVTAGSTGFNLCHQSDTWSNGQWRFFNFNVNNGPMSTFSGKVDIKAMLDWVMKTYSGFTTSMWLTRIEVGAEIDDNTKGSSKIKNITFEINGSSRSIELQK